MGKALEILTFQATAPSTGAAFAAVAGNSSTVRATSRNPVVVAAWQTRQTAGFSRLTSPLLHDGTVGMQMGGPVGTTLLSVVGMGLTPQDMLSVYGSGSATAGDIESFSLLVHYPAIAGIDARYITAAEYRRRLIDLYSFQQTPATGTTGGYSGSAAINSNQDQMKAATDYAILGANFQAGVHAVRWLGPDLGNIGVGMPAAVGLPRSSDWFLYLADLTGLPLIPVINSASKSMTFLDAVTDENGADPIVTTLMGRLS